MRRLLSTFLCVLVSLGCLSSAWAGAGEMSTVVTPLSANVTYSIGGATTPPRLDTFVGYTVSITNSGGNTINNIRFTGTTSVTDAAETATFDSVEGGSCTFSADRKSIDCVIGQVRAGQSAPAFAVFFKAPVKVVNGSFDVNGQDFVNFSGTTFYGEGTGGEPQSTPTNSTELWSTAAVALGTNNPQLVKSVVPKAGGNFFTGNGAVATAADTWTTSVKVPATGAYTTALIAETTGAPPLAPDLLDLSATTLAIPGQFAQLVITLRRDATTILKGAKIASAAIVYDNPSNAGDPRITYPYTVLACTDTTWGVLPQIGIPCINRRIAYTKKTAPTPAWEDDWEFEVFALDNGRYSN
jgi:hypothetical protein